MLYNDGYSRGNEQGDSEAHPSGLGFGWDLDGVADDTRCFGGVGSNQVGSNDGIPRMDPGSFSKKVKEVAEAKGCHGLGHREGDE